ncbi:MAG: pyridoxal-phosphate dependent enzyme [Flavihumibacter sp.]
MKLPVRSDLVRIEPVRFTANQELRVDCLRLDLLDPLISGNKWFKLLPWLQLAREKKAAAIASFGGLWSNHLLAMAAAARHFGIKAFGIIRGEDLPVASTADLRRLGMELIFASRSDYQLFQQEPARCPALPDNTFIIPEGGQGLPGVHGAAALLDPLPSPGDYTHIALAVGTGTSLAGILSAVNPRQKLIGISILKGEDSLSAQINEWVPGKAAQFELSFRFHFGGYARYTPALLAFMNQLYREQQIPLDFVYTAKLFYGIREMIMENYFPPESRLLLVHSGGLPGNRSLPVDSLGY